MFRYRDVLGVQVNTGIMTGTIALQTAGVNTTSGDYWAVHSMGHAALKDDPYKLPSVIPTTKTLIKEYSADLDVIRERVRAAGRHVGSPPTRVEPVAAIAGELAKLAELHRAGVLTDDEFVAAKQRLLST